MAERGKAIRILGRGGCRRDDGVPTVLVRARDWRESPNDARTDTTAERLGAA